MPRHLADEREGIGYEHRTAGRVRAARPDRLGDRADRGTGPEADVLAPAHRPHGRHDRLASLAARRHAAAATGNGYLYVGSLRRRRAAATLRAPEGEGLHEGGPGEMIRPHRVPVILLDGRRGIADLAAMVETPASLYVDGPISR